MNPKVIKPHLQTIGIIGAIVAAFFAVYFVPVLIPIGALLFVLTCLYVGIYGALTENNDYYDI